MFELVSTPSARTFKSVADVEKKKEKIIIKKRIARVCWPTYREYFTTTIQEDGLRNFHPPLLWKKMVPLTPTKLLICIPFQI